MPKNKNSNNSNNSKSSSSESTAKLKPATAINVRHILCTKHSKKEEALTKIRNEGMSFDAVARECSEDKARQGEEAWIMILFRIYLFPSPSQTIICLRDITILRKNFLQRRSYQSYHSAPLFIVFILFFLRVDFIYNSGF